MHHLVSKPASVFGLMLIILIGTTAGALGYAFVDEYKSGIIWPEPPITDPGASDRVPSDAVVLTLIGCCEYRQSPNFANS